MDDPAEDLEREMATHRVAADGLPGVPRRRAPRQAPLPDDSRQKPMRSIKGEHVRVKPSESYDVMVRRRRVQSLRLRQLSYQEIAKELSVGEHVVRNDLEALRKASCDAVDKFKHELELGDSLAVFSEIEARAWVEYEGAVDEDGEPITTQRLKCLDLIRTTRNDKMRAMMDSGLLVKAPEQVEHKVAYQIPWNDQVKKAVAQVLLQQQLTPQLPEPEPDIIDIEPVPSAEAAVVAAPPPEQKAG